MSARRDVPVLDRFRLLAAFLAVCNHTAPLAGLAPEADFWLTRVLARIAVPFFLMVSGYFLSQDGWRGTGRFLKRTLTLYAAAVLLYLPLNWYNGGFSPLEWLKKLLIDGTLYHLWYFPAVLLGVVIARGLARLGLPAALAAALLLYLIGLGGDSYYGLTAQLPALDALYGGLFRLCSYTRNGLFLSPLFLLLGAAGVRLGRGISALGTLLSLAGMSLEAFWLRAQGWPRHDSMYLFLPLTMLFLFSLLLNGGRGQDRTARRLSLLIYLLHPWSIVLVRGAAKLTGLEALLIQNSLAHFCAVAALTLCAALVLDALRPLRPAPCGRAWKELDLDALRHNARTLRSALSPGCTLMAVVKADGYGHGAVPVARCLRRDGVRAFGVACLAEGIALRKAGVLGTILILGYTPPREVPLLRRWHLTQTVADEAHGRALAAQGGLVRVHLALDTGMHRLGLPAGDCSAIARMYRLKNLRIDGVFSHLCVSDSLKKEDMDATLEQLTLFYDTLDWMHTQNLSPGRVHIQASYGVLNLPPQPCAWARAGIALYGVYSSLSPVQRRLDLKPVLSLRARVASVRTLRPGERAGYGLAFQARQETRLAVVTIGYADGLPRQLPQQGGRVLIRGAFCPMAGRMCMDQLLVDVTALPDVQAGDVVTLIGRDGAQELRAEELAARCGTITNELLSRLGRRLELQKVPRSSQSSGRSAETRG